MAALRRWFALILIFVCFASNLRDANSANLTLLTDAPPTAPLVVTPLDALNHQLLVSAVDDTNNDPPHQEFMAAWQFSLRAIPDAGTTGTLNATEGSMPDNYVFADLQTLGFRADQAPGDPTTFNAGDITLPDTAAAHVPTAPGKNLALISFQPSSDALGRFGIYAVDLHTLWVDSSNSGGFRSFVNVPIDDGLTRIGDVVVTVPEPATSFLAVLAVVAGLLGRRLFSAARLMPIGPLLGRTETCCSAASRQVQSSALVRHRPSFS